MATSWSRDALDTHELTRMQRDALERMRQMQARARRYLDTSTEASAPLEEAEPPKMAAPTPQSGMGGMGGGGLPAFSRDLTGTAGNDLSGLIQSLGGDRMMLMALITILISEGASAPLIMALMYLVI